MNRRFSRHSALTAGVILGVGMGGFLDGILFHQILQTHNMLSAVHFPDTLINVQINMFWDGLFNAFTWTTTALGLAVFWRAANRESRLPATKAFLGSLLLGWGAFNLVEGVIDHYILHVHHVVERLGASVWDGAFVGSGVVFILIGWRLMARERRAVASGRMPQAGARA